MASGFFDERFRVPHPPIRRSLHLVVEEAVRVAWAVLRDRKIEGFDLKTAHEDTITLKLFEVLSDEVFNVDVVEGFDRDIFETPAREQSVRNFDGAHPDKEPDLIIRLRRDFPGVRKTQDGIFVECKPVGKSHPVGSIYCDKGISRFVNGDYAWCMLSASMFGYVRRGNTIIPKLEMALQSRQHKFTTPRLPTACEFSQTEANSEAVHLTQHVRNFCYVENGVEAPPITIRHLWLVRD